MVEVFPGEIQHINVVAGDVERCEMKNSQDTGHFKFKMTLLIGEHINDMRQLQLDIEPQLDANQRFFRSGWKCG